LDIAIHSGDICDGSLKLYDMVPNFAHFWPKFLGGKAPKKFWDTDYKTELTSDHTEKFRGNRLMELRDLAKKKLNISNKT